MGEDELRSLAHRHSVTCLGLTITAATDACWLLSLVFGPRDKIAAQVFGVILPRGGRMAYLSGRNSLVHLALDASKRCLMLYSFLRRSIACAFSSFGKIYGVKPVRRQGCDDGKIDPTGNAIREQQHDARAYFCIGRHCSTRPRASPVGEYSVSLQEDRIPRTIARATDECLSDRSRNFDAS